MKSSKALLQKQKLPYHPAKQVLGVSGSPRQGGNADTILRQVLKGVHSLDVAGEGITLGELSFSGCIGCEACRADKICTTLHDSMSELYPQIITCQGLVLVCPVHNYNITAWMKAFIDRLYCFYEFDNTTRPRKWSSRLAGQRRKVTICVICEQASQEDMGLAIPALQLPMEALGYEVVEVLPVFKIFEKGAVKKHKEIMDKAYQLGVRLAESL